MRIRVWTHEHLQYEQLNIMVTYEVLTQKNETGRWVSVVACSEIVEQGKQTQENWIAKKKSIMNKIMMNIMMMMIVYIELRIKKQN